MKTRTVLSCAALLSLLFAIRPEVGSAQTSTVQILYACYIPVIGVIYRIKAPGLPTACLARSHVEFQWNSQGPKGERGEAGAPGNLGLAGQSCPTGSFVTGFTSFGGLVCRSVNGGEVPPDPIPPVIHAMEGRWSFSPALTMRCTEIGANVSFTVRGMTTEVNSAGIIAATLFGTITHPFGTHDNIPLITLPLGPLPTPVTFPLAVSGSRDASEVPSPLSGRVSYTFNGAFSSANAFTTTLSVSANLSYWISPLLNGELTCVPVSGTITAIR